MGEALPAQCWILCPVLASHPHELSLLWGRVSGKGKGSSPLFCLKLGRKHKNPLQKDSWWLLFALKGNKWHQY